MQGERPMIEARGLTKRYGSTVAVNDLSFTIRPGLVTGFLGPNGAGKTTTMRLILGLDYPSGGTVAVNGRQHVRLPSPMHEVGALLDAKAVHGGRSARNHLLCLAQTNDIPPRRVDEVLGVVGLSDVAGKRSKGFSLGMSQRLGIAAALLGDPEILMFDEPVNGLDPEGILWIRTLMRALAAEGRTVFVSSHLMSEMENTADHVVVIGRGRLIADCAMAEFIARSSGQAVLVRTPEPDALARAVTTPVPERVGFDPTQASIVGVALLGQLVIVVLGTLAITSEYSTGMIRTTLTVMPRRGALYGAKAAVFTVVALVIAFLTSFASFFIGQALLTSAHVSATLSQPNVGGAVTGAALYVGLCGLFAFGLGAILRSTAGAMTAAYGLLFLVPQLAKALPSAWYADLDRWLPGGDVVNAITGTQNVNHNPHLFSAWGEFAVFGGYTVILLALGALLFRRRDA
jgi:ABC-2 type transport system ATP-binding protein